MMEWDWYQNFVFMALIVSLGTAWEVHRLRKHLHMEDLTPTKKWKKAISGAKYIPRHKPDQVPTLADEDDLRFFRDFYRVADYLNELYADEPWSFENTGRLDVAHYGSENGSERENLIRYNQQKTGTIKLSCIHYREVDPYDINADLSLTNARVFEGYRVFSLAQSLGQILARGGNEIPEINSTIMAAMIAAMWQVGDEAFGNPPLELSFRGKADWFLKYQAHKSDNPINRNMFKFRKLKKMYVGSITHQGARPYRRGAPPSKTFLPPLALG